VDTSFLSSHCAGEYKSRARGVVRTVYVHHTPAGSIDAKPLPGGILPMEEACPPVCDSEIELRKLLAQAGL
jgi:hypothetical protein